jgi:glycine cleavage system H lipoate-binding protein
MKHTLLSLATVSLASFIGSGIGTGLWLELFEQKTKMSSNTKCQTLESTKPVIKETQQE